MREKINKSVSLLPLLLLIPWHIIAYIDWDDTIFHTMPLTLETLIIRYTTWTSRVFLEILLILTAHYIWLWRITNFIIILLLVIFLQKIVAKSGISLWLLVALILMYPINIMRSTGYVATTLNYLWPLAFGVIALYPLVKICRKEKIKGYEYPLYVLAMIFGANAEQMMLIAVLACVIVTLYLWKTRGISNIPVFAWVQLGLSFASAAFIFLSPGNANRSKEVTWVVDFPRMSFLDKLDIGYSRTLGNLFFVRNDLFLIFCIFLCVLVWMGHKGWLARLVAIAPPLVCLLFGYNIAGTRTAFPVSILEMTRGYFRVFGVQEILEIVSWRHGLHGAVDVMNFNDRKTLMAFFILGVGIICVGISLFLAFQKRSTAWISLGILLAGLASSATVMMSPTVWISGDRTEIYTSIGFLIITVLMFRQLEEKGFKMKRASALFVILGILYSLTTYLTAF